MPIIFFRFLFLLPCLFFAEEVLEVHLATKTHKKTLFLSSFHAEESMSNWRYLEDLRSTLQFDIEAGGFFSLMSPAEELEESLCWANLKGEFPLKKMKEKGVQYALTIEASENNLKITAFHVEKSSAKTYPSLPLSGNLDRDRSALHHFYDKLQKDLFGIEGIGSLKIFYANRSLDPLTQERISEIWKCNIDGTEKEQVSFHTKYSVTPLFSPKKELFYVSFQGGQSKIFKVDFNRQDKKGELFLSLRGNQALPAISPKGTWLAFITDIAGRPDLFLQKLSKTGSPEGKPRQIFTYPRATQASPTFSPDEKRIAFVSDKDGPPRIYILDIPDRKNTQKIKPLLISKMCRENSCPSWSMDGTKLAFSGKIDGVRQIWIYDFSTEEEICLTTGTEMKENPVWAPDNIHLIYNTESEESCELFLLDIRDPKPIQISKGSGQKRFPCWQYPLSLN